MTFRTSSNSSFCYSCKLDGKEGETLGVVWHVTTAGNYIATEWHIALAVGSFESGAAIASAMTQPTPTLRQWVIQNLRFDDLAPLVKDPYGFRSLPDAHPLASEEVLDALEDAHAEEIDDQLEAEFGNVDSFSLNFAARGLPEDDHWRAATTVAIALMVAFDAALRAEIEQREIGVVAVQPLRCVSVQRL